MTAGAHPRLVYDAATAARYRRTRRLPSAVEEAWSGALRELAAGPVAAAVDVGCGIGRFLPVLERAYPAARVVGVEPSDEMRAIASEGASDRREVLAGALPRLPFDAGRFDVVFLSMVVHHCDDPVAALRDCARVLAPGGAIAVRTGTSETIEAFEFLPFYPQALARERAAMPSRETLRRWASAAGLEERRARTIEQRMSPTYEDCLDRVLAGGFPSFAFLTAEQRSTGDAVFAAHCRRRSAAGAAPPAEPVLLLELAPVGASAREEPE